MIPDAGPIFITGVARSGTTLLGNLIGSLEHVEYEFEPSEVLQILNLVKMGLLEEGVAAAVLSSYLAELLVRRMLGRNVNLRPLDDSRFWRTKPFEELIRRWNRTYDRTTVGDEIKKRGYRLAAKIPNITPFYTFLLEAFPSGQIVEIVRNCFDVIPSIVKKGWLSNRGLRFSSVAPSRRGSGDRIIPLWVTDEMCDRFLEWNEHTRALFMWRYLVEEGSRITDRSRILVVRYETLLRSPEQEVARIENFLGTTATLKTVEVLQSIDPSRARHADKDESLLDPEQLHLAYGLIDKMGKLEL